MSPNTARRGRRVARGSQQHTKGRDEAARPSGAEQRVGRAWRESGRLQVRASHEVDLPIGRRRGSAARRQVVRLRAALLALVERAVEAQRDARGVRSERAVA